MLLNSFCPGLKASRTAGLPWLGWDRDFDVQLSRDFSYDGGAYPASEAEAEELWRGMAYELEEVLDSALEFEGDLGEYYKRGRNVRGIHMLTMYFEYKYYILIDE